jgi:hypothetical protein
VYLKTSAVLQLLDVPYYRLQELIRARKIPRPTKDASGDYCWSAEDVERARLALEALTAVRNARQERKAVADAS